LGRQDPHRPPIAPARRRPGPPATRRAVPVDARPHGGSRGRRHPHQQPSGGHRMGGLARGDDRLRPQDERFHLAGCRPRPRSIGRPPRSRCRHTTPRSCEALDPARSIAERGTPSRLATGAGAGASAALVAASVEDPIETARKIAARSRGARLDPPLLLALDEIGNLAPLPSLPTLMAEGGGTGITTLPVLQSLAQARNKWNDNAAGAIWDASIVKIILGGASNSRDLQDLSTLIGERDEYTDSVTLGEHGTRSNQRSIR